MNHGVNGYFSPHRCRCDTCRTAHTAYQRARRQAAADKDPQPEATVTPIRDPGDNWRPWAACRDLPTDWWYPNQAGMNDNNKKALAICATCPVREHCLATSLANREQHGIWGGLNVRNRRQVRRVRQTVTPHTAT